MFNPWKYEITHYPNHKGYNIDILRNKARFLNIFKNNENEIGGRLGLYFDNAETFRELPNLANTFELDELYKKVLEEEKNKGFKPTTLF